MLCPACEAPGNARRKEKYEREDEHAEHGAPIFDVARDLVLQEEEDRRADDGAGNRVDATEQDHDKAIDRSANAERFR